MGQEFNSEHRDLYQTKNKYFTFGRERKGEEREEKAGSQLLLLSYLGG